MKKKLLSALLMMWCTHIVFSKIVLPYQGLPVSAEDAIKAAVSYYAETSMLTVTRSYYMIEDGDTITWKVFVDPKPFEPWEHEAYILHYPKYRPALSLNLTPDSVTSSRLPPSCDMTLHYTPIRLTSLRKPSVATTELTAEQKETGKHTWSIMINGGANKNAHHERYWNNIAFAYQTMLRKYGVPNHNIFVVQGSGMGNANDMVGFGSERYIPCSSDLGIDGGYAQVVAARGDAILKPMSYDVMSLMKPGEHLLLYITGHGGIGEDGKAVIPPYHIPYGKAIPYLYLWNEERFYAYDLADVLRDFLEKGIIVNVVCAQTHGREMCEYLEWALDYPGLVCTAPDSETGLANHSSTLSFSEFDYLWTSAICEATPQGGAVASDTNGDGHVTMTEAFEYVSANANGAPYYSSRPASTGDDLAFTSIPPAVDLYIKDNAADTGREPDSGAADRWWGSPSIWASWNADGDEHEKTVVSGDKTAAYAHVVVHNRGRATYEGEGRYVKLYCSLGATAIDDRVWKRLDYISLYPTARYVGAFPITDTIEPGDSAEVVIRWPLPNYNGLYSEANYSYALAAEVSDTDSEGPFETDTPHFDFAAKRNLAMRNESVLSLTTTTYGGMTHVRNTSDGYAGATLTLVPRTPEDAEAFARADVEIALSDGAYQAWQLGGSQCEGMTQLAGFGSASPRFMVTSPQASMRDMVLSSRQLVTVTVIASYDHGETDKYSLDFDLVQTDDSGRVVGGQAYTVWTSSFVPQFPFDTTQGTQLSIDRDGDMLTVELPAAAGESATLTVTSVTDPAARLTQPVEPGATECAVNVAALPSGAYAVTYLYGDNAAASAKFAK